MNSPTSIRPSLAFKLAGLALLGTLAGCVYPETRSRVVQAPPSYSSGQPAYVQDDFVYYPQYEVYYSNQRHQYYYQDGGAWGWRQQPNHVAVNLLVSSPSVHMDFHDAPDRHHQEVVRQYPKNWHGADNQHKDQQSDRHDDKKH